MSEQASKTSPFIIAASIAVIIVSIVGVGAMTGLIPSRSAKSEAPPATSAQAEPGNTAGEATTPPQSAMTAQADAGKNSKPATQEKPAAKQNPGAKAAAEDNPENAPSPVCGNCGVISSIRAFEQTGEGSGLGVVAGGVVGGLLGHQVGGGSGKDLATIAGAVGGGYAGHQIEKKVKSTTRYKITVRMDDGSQRTLTKKTEPPFAIGDKVKIVDGALVRN